MNIKMNESFLRLSAVMKITAIARSTIWLWVKEGKFPQPIKLSPRVTVWKESDIQDWMKNKVKEVA